jgi:3-phenylpropionate/cinnamic acid dioxygenase small subunit
MDRLAPAQVLEHRLAADGLLQDYVGCIDEGRLEDWPGFFADQCHYRITHAEDFEAGYRHGAIYASSKGMLQDRIASLREANIYEAQRYRHIVGAARIVEAEGGLIRAVASFLVLRIMHNTGATDIFMSGAYHDTLVRAGDRWLYAEKVVVADSRNIDTLLAIPV